MYSPSPACVACGAALSGHYCSRCGEAAHHHEPSLKHFAEEALETFAHVDGRVFFTFRALVTAPGSLAANFLAGRRKAQMGPLQLFVICNLLYFLVQPLTAFAPFTSTLAMQTGARPWSRMAATMVDARVAARGEDREEYARRFNETAHLQGKSLVVLMVPLFAVGAWALYGRSRRFLAEHLVFAFYFYAFTMVWMGASTLLLTKPVLAAHSLGWSGFAIETTFSSLIAVPVIVYLHRASLRTYAEASSTTVMKSVLLAGWLFAVLTMYRFVLFFTTLSAT
jgi:hypothetical protein